MGIRRARSPPDRPPCAESFAALRRSRGVRRHNFHVHAAQTTENSTAIDAVTIVARGAPNRSAAMPVASDDALIVSVSSP